MFRFILICFLVTFGLGTDFILPPQLDGRIVGGRKVLIEDYPYQVSVLHKGKHFCGGSIISKKFIITAAHCTNGKLVQNLSVRVGSSTRNEGGTVHSIKAYHQNPDFDQYLSNDISILELNCNLRYRAGVQPILLADSNLAVNANTEAICTGWGRTSYGGPTASALQEVRVPFVDRSECAAKYAPTQITESMICAGRGEKDACQGDSGGPLVYNGKLIGIVSWGYGCANPKFPGVYANVANLRSFIKKITNI